MEAAAANLLTDYPGHVCTKFLLRCQGKVDRAGFFLARLCTEEYRPMHARSFCETFGQMRKL